MHLLSKPHCVVNKNYLPLSSTLCLNLIIPNITPRGLFSRGGLIHGRSFLFQKLVPKRPGAYKQWGLLSEFYGILIMSLLAKHNKHKAIFEWSLQCTFLSRKEN